MSREHVSNLIGQLGEILRLKNLKIDETGFCSITFDNKIIVSFDYFEENDSLFIYTPLGNPSEKISKEIYREALSGNFFWKDTGGSTLAIEENTNSLVMFDKLDLTNLDISGFLSIIENFVNYSEEWYDKINPNLDSKQEETKQEATKNR